MLHNQNNQTGINIQKEHCSAERKKTWLWEDEMKRHIDICMFIKHRLFRQAIWFMQPVDTCYKLFPVTVVNVDGIKNKVQETQTNPFQFY